jgi:hypothetical protein
MRANISHLALPYRFDSFFGFHNESSGTQKKLMASLKSQKLFDFVLNWSWLTRKLKGLELVRKLLKRIFSSTGLQVTFPSLLICPPATILKVCKLPHQSMKSENYNISSRTGADTVLLSEIQAQIRFCMRRNDDMELKRVFDNRKVRVQIHLNSALPTCAL